ncbi:MAG: hypothetical protein ACKO38_04255 [Planctomycetota bacterium]
MDRRRFVLIASFVGSGSAAGAFELTAHRARTRPGCLEGIPGAPNYQYRPRSESVFSGSQRGVLFAVPLRDTADQLERLKSLRVRLPVNSLPAPVTGTPAGETPVASVYDSSLEGEWTVGTAEEVPAGIIVRPDLVLPGGLPGTVRPGARRSGGTSSTPRSPTRPNGAAQNSATHQPSAVQAAAKLPVRLYQLNRVSLAVDHCQVSEIALLVRADAFWSLSLRADQNRRSATADEAGYNPRLHLKRNEFHLRLRCLGGLATATNPTSQAAAQPAIAMIEPEPFWVERGQPKFHQATGYARSGDQWLNSLDVALIDRVEIEFFFR